MTGSNLNFGDRLLEAIIKSHLTQKELADKAEVTEAAVSHYIKGDRIPRSAVLMRIAAVLNTTPEYLMDGVPKSYVDEYGQMKRLIARNVHQMSNAEKREIINILLSD